MHVARDRDGRRRLTEIALLRRTASGQVQAAPVWQVERGLTDYGAEFHALLRARIPT